MFNKNFSTKAILVAIMISGLTVALSSHTASAESANELFRQLEAGQEPSYKISIDVGGLTRAVGIFGDCSGEKDSEEMIINNVTKSECVFSVDSVRYIPTPRANDFVLQTEFDVICIDNLEEPEPFGEIAPKWSNCSFLDRGNVEIGLGGTVGAGLGVGFSLGEVGEGGLAIMLEPKADISIGIDAIRLEYQVKSPQTFQDRAVGGNVLVDSGIGSVLATKFVILAHNNYKGTVEFLGSKPLNMKMTVGSTNSSDKEKIKCNDSLGNVKTCDKDFVFALDQAFPVSESASAELGNAAIGGAPTPIRISGQNIQASVLNQIVAQTTPQLTALLGVSKDMALELIDLDQNISMLEDMLDDQLILKTADALVEDIKEIKPESFLSDILNTIDPDGKLPDFVAIFEGIPDLLEPLEDLDGLIKSIPDPSDIGDDIGKVSGGIKDLNKGVTGGNISFDLPSPLKGLTCKIGVSGSPSCTGAASVKLPGVFSGLTCSVPSTGSPSCSGKVVGRVDGVARCTFDVSGSLSCVACSQASIPFACIDKACSCEETCAGDKRIIKTKQPC